MRLLYVETNFLIEHARGEKSESELIVAAAERGDIDVVLPVFCVFEAIQKLRRETPEHEASAKKLADLARQLERKKMNADQRETFQRAAEALRKLNDAWRSGLEETLERLLPKAKLLPVTKEHVGPAMALMPYLRTGDPWHVAAVLEHHGPLDPATEHLCLTGDTDVQAYLEKKGLKVVAVTEAVVAAWELNLR